MISSIWQILIALFLGVAIGVERSVAHKTAGMRTYGLLSMGSCLFILISKFILPAGGGYADPERIAAGVIMGVGFLCGGVIMVKDQHLSGLTTAAGLWVAAGVGMAVGFNLIPLAIYTTFVTLFAFTVLWILEQYVVGKIENVHMLEKSQIDE
ncbi:MgtC/SapB family protein [Candidatus Parcubacteria bacterium]|nr:MgtC/SapB family protein [Candidatus Parcubacteria bacterium]